MNFKHHEMRIQNSEFRSDVQNSTLLGRETMIQ